MFRLGKKKPKQTTSVSDRVSRGELSVEAGQKLLDVKKLEASVVDVEHEARDHGNLVELRKTWGRVILAILILTIVGDFILIGLVGSDVWKFTGNGWFLNVVATEHLVQIFGLVLIVLKSLFPKEKS